MSTPPRPRVTAEMKLEAARALASQNHWNEEQAVELAQTFERYEDGYELAKKLESRHCWDITVSDVEALDQMDSEVSELHRQACIVWARENDIQPPHPIGTMTTRGEITGVSSYAPATYEVRQAGEQGSRRLLVLFEQAFIPEPAAA